MKFADPTNDIAFKKIFGDKNKQELDVYNYIALKEYDEINALETAEKKGIKKGIEQGVQSTKIEVTKNLLKEGYSIELIIKITGLTKETIEQFNINKL